MNFLKNTSSLSPLVVSPADIDDVDKAAVEYLQNLVTTAKETAFAHACSSVLAGQSSEADDLEDGGLWLGRGEYGKDHADNVSRALGLEGQVGQPPRYFELGSSRADAFRPLNGDRPAGDIQIQRRRCLGRGSGQAGQKILRSSVRGCGGDGGIRAGWAVQGGMGRPGRGWGMVGRTL